MSRFVPIRITRNDKREYQRLVKNTKAKVRRTLKNYGVDLSDEINIPDINEFKTRSEFNRWKREQRSFTNRANLHYQFRKNKYGVVASKSEILKAELRTKQAQENAKKFIKEHKENLPRTEKAREVYLKQPDYGGVTVPKDFDFGSIRSRRDLEKRLENILKRASPKYYDEKMTQMKMNYMKALDENFNSWANKLIDLIGEMSPDDFFNMYLQNRSKMEFSYIYTLDDSKAQEEVERIESFVDDYYSDFKNMDLKGF